MTIEPCGKLRDVSCESVSPGRGRRLDPDIEGRVLAAALEVYGEVGWAKLNLDIVARRAQVGKAALYRRWRTKEQLVEAALATRKPPPEVFDTGSLRVDLLAVTRALLDSVLGPHGLVVLRAQVEAKIYPDMFDTAIQNLRLEQTKMGREIIIRGIDRGELPVGTSPAMILDALAGIINQHFLMTPADRVAELDASRAEYVERVVDFVLKAADYRPPLPRSRDDS
ncbi:TetR/AcrR family transcriptional regulator [Saccharopolyspora sp. 5N708]|uniref:TetR/AcrR family transcriptional regulator n=1 Tax=Saccharopolyspora sp. 5N708 TaxID=3457424 RepID=UPI003FD0DA09